MMDKDGPPSEGAIGRTVMEQSVMTRRSRPSDTLVPAAPQVASHAGPRLPEAGGWVGWGGRRLIAAISAREASVEAATACWRVDMNLARLQVSRGAPVPQALCVFCRS